MTAASARPEHLTALLTDYPHVAGSEVRGLLDESSATIRRHLGHDDADAAEALTRLRLDVRYRRVTG